MIMWCRWEEEKVFSSWEITLPLEKQYREITAWKGMAQKEKDAEADYEPWHDQKCTKSSIKYLDYM